MPIRPTLAGTRAQKERTEIAKHAEAMAPEGHRPRTRRHGLQPAVARRRQDFSVQPDENFTQKVNRKMYRAGVASILSQLAREDRLAVVESFVLEAPKTKLLASKLKDMGSPIPLLMITDSSTTTCFCLRAICPMCWCWMWPTGRSGFA